MHFFNNIFYLLYPPRCPLCDSFVKERDIPCETCDKLITRLGAEIISPEIKGLKVDSFYACFIYDGPVRDAVISFKYGAALNKERFFGKELVGKISRRGDLDVVVPVPLHSKKLKERGFNQSAILARIVARKLKIKSDVTSLVRTADLGPQAGQHREERFANIKGAFEVKKGREGKFKGKSVLLIDDVFTTGATAGECAKALKRAGAASVVLLTLARA